MAEVTGGAEPYREDSPSADPGMRPPQGGERKLHQVGAARRRQGLSVRCVAQRLGIPASEVSAQEDEHTDMLLSELYRWQAAVDVPITELIVGPTETLSPPVLTRARMLLIMKTAMAIRRGARSEAERSLARLLIDQILEIMPELREVSAWPTVGHRRTADEMGRIAENPISDDWIRETS